MKLGCCVGPAQLYGAAGPERLEEPLRARLERRLEWFASIGCDFVELGVAWIDGLPEEEFEALRQALSRSPVKAPVCNLFVPAQMRITGTERDFATLRAYVQRALDRVAQIGSRYVVFGSGRARRIPEGYDEAAARRELVEFARMAADEAGARGLTILLEPLRKQECNVLNFVSEGYRFVRELDHPHFKLLADSYHMEELGEPLSVLAQVASELRHVHTADTKRVPPGAGEYDHHGLIRTLREVGYAGELSIECSFRDFESEAPAAVAHLRRVLGAAE